MKEHIFDSEKITALFEQELAKEKERKEKQKEDIKTIELAKANKEKKRLAEQNKRDKAETRRENLKEKNTTQLNRQLKETCEVLKSLFNADSDLLHFVDSRISKEGYPIYKVTEEIEYPSREARARWNNERTHTARHLAPRASVTYHRDFLGKGYALRPENNSRYSQEIILGRKPNDELLLTVGALERDEVDKIDKNGGILKAYFDFSPPEYIKWWQDYTSQSGWKNVSITFDSLFLVLDQLHQPETAIEAMVKGYIK